MNNTFKQILLLGGICDLVAIPLNMSAHPFFSYLSTGISIFWFSAFIVLLMNKSFAWLEKIDKFFPKSSIYIMSFGAVNYLFLLVAFYGIYDGYQAAAAELNHMEYHSQLEGMAEYIIFVYIVLVLLALSYATYINFFRKKS
nr:MAG TPA: hypothetical protein [Caudoviricetes sp.]